jgi:hypothetical protein
MNTVTRDDFQQLIRQAQMILVAVNSPSGVTVYFEIDKDVAEVKVDDIAKDRIPFEMDSERFLWIGDKAGKLQIGC